MSTVLTPAIAQPGRRDLVVGLALILLLIQILAAGAALAFGWIWTLAPWALLLGGIAILAPRLGVYLLATALYFKVSLPGLRGVYPADLLAFCVIVGTFAGRLVSGRRLVEPSPLNKPILVILAILAISLVGAYQLRPGIVNWMRHAQILCLCLAITATIDRRDIHRVLGWILFVTLIIAVVNIGTFFITAGSRRIFGPTGWFFATLLSLGTAHAAVGFLLCNRLLSRVGWATLLLVYGMANIAGLTRSAWLQAALMLTILSAVLWRWAGTHRQRAIRLRLATLILATVIITLYILFGHVALFEEVVVRMDRLIHGESRPIQSRLFLWQTGLRLFLDSPILGTGLGQVKQWDQIAPFWRFDIRSQYTHGLGAHNDAITYLSETGVLGTLAIFWLFGSVLAMGWRTLKRCRQPHEAYRILVIWIPACGIVVHYFYAMYTFYSIAGFLTALYFGMLAKYCSVTPAAEKPDGENPYQPQRLSEDTSER